MPRPRLPPRPAALTAEVYENIRRCRGVSFAEKASYLTEMALCGGDLGCAEATHQRLCKAKAHTGLAVKNILPDEGLGVLIEQNNFIKYTSAAFGKSVSDF